MSDRSTDSGDQRRTDGGSNANDGDPDGSDGDPDGTAGSADGTESDAEAEFAAELANARSLLDGQGVTACYVGVVREGREVDSTFAQQAGDPQQEGMQALSLLASHLRLVADEAGVDYTTVAGDAASLAQQLDEPGQALEDDTADGD